MSRLDYFMERKSQNRHWWFQENNYLPAIYANLSEDEFGILTDWFNETEELGTIGECGIPSISVMLGLIEGSNIDAIVQLGHYAGYSTLLLGWALKRMGKEHALFSIDIDPDITNYAWGWVEKAGLEKVVGMVVADSSDREVVTPARAYLHQDPKLVFIDSSHQYLHTSLELSLWGGALQPGGIIVLHDTSDHARKYDATKAGGVRRALVENELGLFQGRMIIMESPVYADGCGLGIIQK